MKNKRTSPKRSKLRSPGSLIFSAKQWVRGRLDLAWSGGRKWKIIAVILIVALAAGIIFWRANTIRGKYEGLSDQGTYAATTIDSTAYYWKNGLKKYGGSGWTSRNGIDVSAYQGSINWSKVKKAGITFVMIRAGYRGSTDGTIIKDKRFAENLKGAKAAGLDVGVYFYSSAVSAKEAVEEAKWTLKQIQHQGITMPVAFDMEEDSSSRTYKLTMRQKTKITDAFCSIVRQNGYKPLIYGNPTWIYNSLDLSYLTRYNLWIAHYTNQTNFQYQYIMWQYSESGRLPGITGTVDMDILLQES